MMFSSWRGSDVTMMLSATVNECNGEFGRQ